MTVKTESVNTTTEPMPEEMKKAVEEYIAEIERLQHQIQRDRVEIKRDAMATRLMLDEMKSILKG